MASKKILVADDDRGMLQLVSLALSRAGYQVITAMDAYQAVQFACEQTPDVIILDIFMPAGNGLSVQQRMQKVGALCTKPVIYLTGDHSDQVKAEAQKMGAFAVLHKPFDSAELLAIVHAALGEEAPIALASA